MNQKKFIIPSRKKTVDVVNISPTVRISKEAYMILVDMYNESTLSMCELVSKAVMYANENAVYEKE